MMFEISELCRTCMKELSKEALNGILIEPQQNWRLIFDRITEYNSLRIIDMLSTTTPQLKVQLCDQLPKKICHECLKQLQNHYEFQQMCLQSDQKMHELVAKGNAPPTMSNLETPAIDAIFTKAFLKEEFIDTRYEENEVEYLNKLPTVSLATTFQLLDSSNEVSDGVENEACDEDEFHVEYSVGETLISTVSVKKETITETTLDTEVRSASPANTVSQPIEKCLTDYNRFMCNMCKRCFYQKEKLHEHYLAHEDKSITKYTCELCGFMYTSHHSLRSHKVRYCANNLEIEVKRYPCGSCDKVFKHSTDLKDHKREHTGERPYLCSECGKSFSKSSNLRKHRLRHKGVKCVECPYCPMKFVMSGDLSKHKKVHQEVKAFVCVLCGEGFVNSFRLKIHEKYHKSVETHKCDHCDKCFMTKGQKNFHMRKHTGERPYKCKYCDKTYSHHTEYIRHLRTHLGKNVYRCELCPLAFRSYSELRAHFAMHKHDDEGTRERNRKALEEETVKLELKLKLTANKFKQS